MNDFFRQISTAVAEPLRTSYPDLRVMGEFQKTPPRFPCLTIEEIGNLPAGLDSGDVEPRSRITYRVQVFCLREEGGKGLAREIMASASAILAGLNFTRKACIPQNKLYRANFYTMTSTFEAEVDENGVLYRTR